METDDSHTLQHVKLTSYPPKHPNVTQYTSHLTSYICKDISVWQHTILNACEDHIHPHPLQNLITIFNIHYCGHFNTLATDNHAYHHYDPLHNRPPPSAKHIHSTLRQLYSNTYIAQPILHPDTPHINIASMLRQTDGWSYGLHMLLINLTTIYQCNIPKLYHTQELAHTLSRILLRYILTGRLDPQLAQIHTNSPTHTQQENGATQPRRQNLSVWKQHDARYQTPRTQVPTTPSPENDPSHKNIPWMHTNLTLTSSTHPSNAQNADSPHHTTPITQNP